MTATPRPPRSTISPATPRGTVLWYALSAAHHDIWDRHLDRLLERQKHGRGEA